MSKPSAFTTHTVDVVWSHLHAPDDKFGADSANHNITILVDEELNKTLDEIMNTTNASKINGMRVDDEGRSLLKVKSKAFVKKDVHVFPCRDAQSKRTDAVPFGGDKVRLRLSPAVLTRDQSLSFYLNGVQIIDKQMMDTGGFEPTEGFDGSTFTPPVKEEETEEAPF
jgi:hypothetical protein